MSFQKIHAPSIKELFLSQIKGMILSGELQPGDRLPSERELADRMEISKTIVHEGIRELVRMGFLAVESRRGVYVADYTRTGNLDTLLAIIDYRGGRLDAAMLKSLLTTRLYIECPAMELVAAHHTPAMVKEIRAAEAALAAAASESAAQFTSALFLYHRTITSLSGNTITPMIMNAFFAASQGAWEEYCEVNGRDRVLAAVHDITGAIEAGDGARAVEIFRGSIAMYPAPVSG